MIVSGVVDDLLNLVVACELERDLVVVPVSGKMITLKNLSLVYSYRNCTCIVSWCEEI